MYYVSRATQSRLVSKKKQKFVVIKLAERSTPFSCWIERDRVGKKNQVDQAAEKMGP
jgi:hypothetical protein